MRSSWKRAVVRIVVVSPSRTRRLRRCLRFSPSPLQAARTDDCATGTGRPCSLRTPIAMNREKYRCISGSRVITRKAGGMPEPVDSPGPVRGMICFCTCS
jgi:hypothetical protein